METISQISESELVILRAIWQCGGTARFSQIMEGLRGAGQAWKANTVLTFLARLTEKGALVVKKQGRLNEYSAVLTDSGYRDAQAQILLDKVYKGNAKSLVLSLVRGNRINQQDWEELQEFWDKGAKK